MNQTKLTRRLYFLSLSCSGLYPLVAGADPSNPPSLSDEQAAEIIEKIWNASSWHIRLGTYYVTGSGDDPSKDVISYSHFRDLQKYAAASAIHIVATAKTTSNVWDKIPAGSILDSAPDRGNTSVLGEITVIPNPQNSQYVNKKNPSELDIPMGKFNITKVISTDIKTVGVNSYSIVKLLYHAEWTDFTYKFMALSGSNWIAPDRKAIELLKFDPFASEWKEVTTDSANLKDDFQTNKVDSYLAGTSSR